MPVKRYDFDCYAFYDSARLTAQECDDGDYVLHSDYAALLARHTALVEAVVKFCAEVDLVDDEYPATTEQLENYISARAKVLHLINLKPLH